MCIWCTYFGAALKTKQLPPPNTSFLMPDCALGEGGQNLITLTDWNAVSYLGKEWAHLMLSSVVRSVVASCFDLVSRFVVIAERVSW